MNFRTYKLMSAFIPMLLLASCGTFEIKPSNQSQTNAGVKPSVPYGITIIATAHNGHRLVGRGTHKYGCNGAYTAAKNIICAQNMALGLGSTVKDFIIYPDKRCIAVAGTAIVKKNMMKPGGTYAICL